MYPTISPENAADIREIARARCGFITELAWSSDGKMLAAAHGGGVWLWSFGFDTTPTLEMQPHDGPVKGIAFSPDGRLLATAGADATVRLVATADGRVLSTIRAHRDSVEAVAFSPDGTTLASGSADRTVSLLDLRSAGWQTLEGHAEEVSALAFAGDTLASASRDRTVRLWSSGRPEQVLTGHSAWVRDIAAAVSGERLASCDRDGAVLLWQMGNPTPTLVAAEEGDSRAVTFSPDARLLAAAHGSDFRLWDVDTKREVAHVAGHDRPIVTLAFHPAGNLLASGSGDNTIRLWGVTG